MKAALAILFVATLLLAPLAAAAETTGTAGAHAAPATAAADASAAPDGGAASTQPPPAASTDAAVAPAAPGAAAPPAAPLPAEWLYACVPQCSYYYGICQEECSGLGGIKYFTCTPPPPGLCAHFTCTCNKGL
ncbi:MAG TPA: hypothetical protein VMW75_12385 [Thermoanaerobaculia bacterium]|nr:hypothetical protein [Thermoanaerobaculia bacterium]